MNLRTVPRVHRLECRDPQWRTASYSTSEMVGAHVGVDGLLSDQFSDLLSAS